MSQRVLVPGTSVGRGRLDSLTPLRFVAAFLVFVTHVFTRVWYAGGDPEHDFGPALMMRISLIGVEFFFILSGFVLTWSARDTDTVRGFWRRRTAKIFPNHAVTWLIGLLLLFWIGQRVTVARGAATLFLVDAWVPARTVQLGVNSVSWSLCCEAFFYLCFPLWLIAKIRPHLLWLHAAGCAVFIALIPVAVMRLTPAEPTFVGLHATELQVWLTYNFPVTRCFEFVLGMILARIVATGRWYPRRFSYGLIGLVIGVALAMALYYPYGDAVFLAIPLSLLILATAGSDADGRGGVLRRPSWIWLGDVSFAFYMTHWLIMQYTYPLIDPQDTAPALLKIGYSVGYLLVSLVASWLLYRLVERPVMRGWSRRRPAKRTAMEHGRP